MGEARSRGGLLLFVDYAATLRPGASDGLRLPLSLLARGALVALATAPDTRVVITSDEDAGRLETHINVPGIVYAGSRGLQVRGAGMAFCHPVAARVKERLPHVARELSENLAPLDGVAADLLGRIAFAWSVAGRDRKGGEGSPETTWAW